MLPIADAARATFAAVDLAEEQAAHVRFGRPLDLTLPGDAPHAVFAPDGEFLALYEQRGCSPTGGGLRLARGGRPVARPAAPVGFCRADLA